MVMQISKHVPDIIKFKIYDATDECMFGYAPIVGLTRNFKKEPTTKLRRNLEGTLK